MFDVISSYKFTITFFVVHISELELSLIYVRRRSSLVLNDDVRSLKKEKNNETLSEFPSNLTIPVRRVWICNASKRNFYVPSPRLFIRSLMLFVKLRLMNSVKLNFHYLTFICEAFSRISLISTPGESHWRLFSSLEQTFRRLFSLSHVSNPNQLLSFFLSFLARRINSNFFVSLSWVVQRYRCHSFM